MSDRDKALESTGRRHGRTLFTLQGADDHSAWFGDLKDQAHYLTGKPAVLAQDFRATLDPSYFKSHKDFKTAFAAASKDDDEQRCDPFDKEDQEFAKLCFEHGMATGDGLYSWVRTLYHVARDALSREIKNQTASVQPGDIFGLLQGIQLAVNQLEVFDSTELDAAFTKCTGRRGQQRPHDVHVSGKALH